MIYILDCNSSLGTCCNDYGIAIFIAIIKNAIEVIQIAVPILLITMSMVQLFKMLSSPNPEDKKGVQSLKNKFVAAAIVFFLPIFVNITISVVGEGINTGGLDVIKCYKSSSTVEVMNRTRTRYIKKETKNKEPVKVTFDESDVADGSDGVNPNDRETKYKNRGSSAGGLASGSAQGIIDGAEKVHTMYEQQKWTYSVGGDLFWNDIEKSTNNPNKVACCATLIGSALYVGGVLSEQELNSFNYNYVPSIDSYLSSHNWIKVTNYSDLQAGDIVIMPGHVQLYAGNGTWYNAGSTNAIQRDSPYSDNCSGRFLHAWRIPA